MVGFPPGGSADIVARIVAQALTERMGQTFIVDNKPGAGSNLGTEMVARAEPDGYTLMADSVSNAINPTLYKKLSYDQLKDLIPVASIDVVPNVMDINLDMPVKTVPEFIAYGKANPGKISMGSGGIGSSPHVAGELFKMMTGVDMLHIPYRGVAPATADLLGGRLQVLFDTLPAAIGNIRAGKIHALAVTSKKRSDSLPDVPAMNEFVPGYEADSFHGISAPKGTPRRDRREAQCRDQRGGDRYEGEGAAGRARRRGVHRHARGLRPLSGGRDRALGQGDPVFRREGGVRSGGATRSLPSPPVGENAERTK